MRYAYDTLKNNCYRRKGKEWFELTFEEFKQFAVDFDYISGKGKTKSGKTIDCKDPTMGYFVGNIAPQTNSYNSRKRKKFLHYEWSEHNGRMMAYLTDNDFNDNGIGNVF